MLFVLGFNLNKITSMTIEIIKHDYQDKEHYQSIFTNIKLSSKLY